jgi:hypothetical protein
MANELLIDQSVERIQIAEEELVNLLHPHPHFL